MALYVVDKDSLTGLAMPSTITTCTDEKPSSRIYNLIPKRHKVGATIICAIT
jgi:hypothetical protein